MDQRKTRTRELTGRAFDALPDVEKQRIFDELESGTPERRRAEATAPTAAEKARLHRVHKKMGRPKIGNRVKDSFK